MAMQVTEYVTQTTAGVIQHYWRDRKKSCLTQYFLMLFGRAPKTRSPFPDLSSHLAVQVK